jgi:hypothetical protein
MITEGLKYSLKKDGEGEWSEPFPDLDSENTVVFVFGAPVYYENQHPFEELKANYPKSIIVGCSTAGEIYQDRVTDNSLSLAIVKFEKTKVKASCLSVGDGSESEEIGRSLITKLFAEDLKGVMVFSDGISVNGSALSKGMNDALGKKKDVVITGGLAGDGSSFKKTWVIKDGKPMANHVLAIGFYGDSIVLKHGSQGGWDIFGPERKITRSENNILYEIDGKPALDLYKKYLGDKSKDLPSSGLLFPLQIRKDKGDEKYLVRTILGVNEEQHSLTFAGDMPQGWNAQLMRANFDRLIGGAATAAILTETDFKSKHPVLCIAISCVGRRLVLGQRIDQEVEATLENLPQGTRQVGFYSYGEISPLIHGESCELHNQTMTLTLMSEAS